MQHRILAGSELEGWRIMLLNFLSFEPFQYLAEGFARSDFEGTGICI
jgi:hypothetical protein